MEQENSSGYHLLIEGSAKDMTPKNTIRVCRIAFEHLSSLTLKNYNLTDLLGS
jgi:hypothetical protein